MKEVATKICRIEYLGSESSKCKSPGAGIIEMRSVRSAGA